MADSKTAVATEIAVKLVRIKVSNFELTGRLVIPSNRRPMAVMFVSGAGKFAIPCSVTDWQDELADMGYASLYFAFPGFGSPGKPSDNSLVMRIDLADGALRWFMKQIQTKAVCLVGISMGAHVAVRLAERATSVKALILAGAAAYAAAAENKRFGRPLTKIITVPESWQTSPVFEALPKLKLPTLLAYGETEDVIPMAVQKLYHQSLGSHAIHLSVPGHGHLFMSEPLARNVLFVQAARFLDDLNDA